jgi:hypothetical protein
MDFRNYLFGRIGTIVLFAVMMAMFAVPASADTVCNNGNSDDTTTLDVAPISNIPGDTFPQHRVADPCTVKSTFTLTSVNFQVIVKEVLDSTGARVNQPTSVDWAIGTTPFTYDVASGTDVTLTSKYITNVSGEDASGNYVWWDIYGESFDPTGVTLVPSTDPYYLTLQNATSSAADPVYWNEIGPLDPSCTAYQDDIYNDGPIPCENFQILGTSAGTPVPEPATLTLLGTGLLFLVGRRRRTSR